MREQVGSGEGLKANHRPAMCRCSVGLGLQYRNGRTAAVLLAPPMPFDWDSELLLMCGCSLGG
jgi:hypothetical protein